MAELELDPGALAEQAVLLGLITQDQAREAKEDAEEWSLDGLSRAFVRKGMLTSWQVDKFKKGDLSGFFYGGCKVLFHLAEGTFARVYRGTKAPGHQPVAIKVLRQRFVSNPGAIDRFLKEAEAGMRLVHPNIVQIHNYGEEEKRYYMIMEYVEGSNLRDFLRIRKRLDAKEALPMMVGLARGLQFSMESGVTHRDIKGSNILIGSNGAAKLVDFGLATIEGDEKTMTSQRTVDYSALERTCGSPKGDPRSDIFFLGCVYYQMITGQLPLPEVETKDMLAKMLKRSFGAIKPLSEQRHAPHPELCRIIEKMMQMDLKKRYQAMEEVVRDLETFEAQMQKPAEPAPKAKKSGGRMGYVDPQFGTHDEIFGRGAFEVPAFEPKNVLCVEVQSEIQEAMRKTLSKMGYRVLIVTDAERAAERYREDPPHAVVFDADGLGADALDSFLDMHEKAHEDGHDLAAVVLLGPRQREMAAKLPAGDRLVVLQKPIKMKDVQDALSELVPIS